MADKLKSRKFWALIVFGLITGFLVWDNAIPRETWKWFVGLALPGYFLGQGLADGARRE